MVRGWEKDQGIMVGNGRHKNEWKNIVEEFVEPAGVLDA
jgi:hypothetical protein